MSGAAYERLFELGRGGMGTAYLARALGTEGFQRLVVLKRLLPHLMQHPDAVRRFLGEAKVAAALHHSNIVGVHQSGQDDEGHFIVYDYVEGAALDELKNRLADQQQRMPLPVLLRIALDAASGLHAAHTARDNSGRQLNILHRDISPENLLVGRDGVTRILDFGIAKSVIASVTTDQNYLMGKLMYMAPEYLARAPAGPGMDIYALGVSLWVALAGDIPWPNTSEAQLVTRIAHEGVPRISGSVQGVPPAFDELLSRATALDPAERFASALDLMHALERLDRATGWMASHREVAQLVEEQHGPQLDQRRRLLAVTCAPQPGAPAHSAATHRRQLSEPIPLVQRAASEHGAAVSRGESELEPMALPIESGRTRWLAFAALVVTLGLLAGLFGLRRAQRDSSDAARIFDAGAPALGNGAASAAASAAPPVLSASPPAASTSTPPGPKSQARPTSAGNAAANSSSGEAPPSAAPPSAAPPSAAATATAPASPPISRAPVSAEPGIQKANPYRAQ